MNTKDCTRNLLIEHYKKYPEIQIQDIFKFLYQSTFGCEHLIADSSATTDYIRKEASECYPHAGELIEPLEGEYCRVHLDYLQNGLNAETLGKLLFLSAKSTKNTPVQLEEKLSVMTKLITEGLLPFSKKEAEEEIRKWRELGYPACHHSEQFRNTYHPAYRVIRKEYALFLPFLSQIDSLLQHEQISVAIEGGSAGGKTTLSELLEKIYDCNIFHMDDFFLRPEQRTEERLSEAGGNVDRERFLSDVLIPLSKNESIQYRRFDCSTATLLPARTMEPKKLNVIEGAYSMHPLLEKYYDISLFLDITSDLQIKRITKRNSPDMATRFFAEWIPMEQQYFDTMKVKQRCSIIISVTEQ